MKTLLLAFALGLLAFPLTASDQPSSDSPLTPREKALVFSRSMLRTDESGHGLLFVHGEPLSQPRIRALSPWDLMELVQALSGVEVPLSRFGNNDTLTQVWRLRLASFAATADAPPAPPPEDLFDPALVLWDPGFIQTKNPWGQWSIHIENRDIVQADLPTLSPLEVQQAVEVLTARSYPIEFVLEHLEAFRAQLWISPRE